MWARNKGIKVLIRQGRKMKQAKEHIMLKQGKKII